MVAQKQPLRAGPVRLCCAAMRNLQAVILCAGLGTRLRPLTLATAKPAVPLLGRPLVGYGLELLQRAGFDGALINTHWQPEAMAAAAQAEARALGMGLAVSHEPEILGTGGVFRQLRASGLLDPASDLLVLNGDVLFDVDLPRVLERHRATGAAATMVLRPMPPGGGYSPVEADAEGWIRRIGPHGVAGRGTGRLFTGVHVLSPRALDLLPPGESGVVERLYAPLLAGGDQVQAVEEPGTWLDLGDPAGYLEAHLTLLGGDWPLARHGVHRPAAIHPEARVDASARLVRTSVGAGAQVGAGAVLDDCVLWPGARVADGERLSRTIVTGSVRVAVPLQAGGISGG